MAKIVRLPNGTSLRFPDDMAEEDMKTAIYSNFPEFAPDTDNALMRGLKAASQPAGRATVNLLSYLNKTPEEQRVEALKSLAQQTETKPTDISWDAIKSRPLGTVGSLLGEQIPQMAPMVGAAALTGGSSLAGAAAMLPGYYTQNLARQEAEKGYGQEEYGKAGLSALGQSTLDTALGVGSTLRGAFAKKTAEEAVKQGLLKRIAVGSGKTLAEEVPTEIAQQGLERWQAGLPLTDKEALEEYGQTAKAVALTAPIMGGGFKVLENYNDNIVAKREKEIKDAEDRLRLEELARAQLESKQAIPELPVSEQPSIYEKYLSDELNKAPGFEKPEVKTIPAGKMETEELNDFYRQQLEQQEATKQAELLSQERQKLSELALQERQKIAELAQSKKPELLGKEKLSTEAKKIGEYKPIFDEAILNENDAKIKADTGLTSDQLIKRFDDIKKQQEEIKKIYNPKLSFTPEQKSLYNKYNTLNTRLGELRSYEPIAREIVKQKTAAEQMIEAKKEIVEPTVAEPAKQVTEPQVVKPQVAEPAQMEMELAQPEVKAQPVIEEAQPIVEAKPEVMARPEVVKQPAIAEQPVIAEEAKPIVSETPAIAPYKVDEAYQLYDLNKYKESNYTKGSYQQRLKFLERMADNAKEKMSSVYERPENRVKAKEYLENVKSELKELKSKGIQGKATPAEVKSAQTVEDIDNLLNNKKLTKIQTEALIKRKAKLSPIVAEKTPIVKKTAEFKPSKTEKVIKKLDDNHVIVDKIIKNRHEYSEHVYDKNNKKWEKTENIHDNPAKVEQEHKETQELLAKRGLKEAGQTELPPALIEKAPEETKSIAETYETKKAKVELGTEISVENADKLKSELNKMVGDKVSLKFVDFINSISKESGSKEAAGGVFVSSKISKGAKDLIVIAGNEEQNITDAIPHETIHFLKRTDVLSKSEWNLLTQAALNKNWVDKHDIIGRYVKSGQIIDVNSPSIVEEAIAEEFREFYNSKKEAPKSIIGKIFGKLKDFINGLKNHFANNKEDYEEIFDKITAGNYAINENIMAKQTGQKIKIIPEVIDDTAASAIKSITGEDTILETPIEDLVKYYLSQSKVKDLLGEAAYKTDTKLTPNLQAEYDALVEKAWTKILNNSTPEQREIFKGVPKMERSDVLRAVIKMNDRGDIISDYKSYEQLDNSIKEIIPDKLFPVLQGANELYNSFKTTQIDKIGLFQWLETPYSVFQKSLQGSRLFNAVKDMHNYSRAVMAKQSDKISGIFKDTNDKDTALLNKYLHEKRTDVNKSADKKAASATLKANEEKGIFKLNDGTELSERLGEKVLKIRELFKDTLKPFQEAVAEELKVNPEDITPKFIEKYLEDKKGNTKQLKIAAGMKSVFDKLSPENMDYSYIPNMRFGRNYIMVTDKTAKTSSGEPMPLYFERFDYESVPELLESVTSELFGSTIGNKATENKRNKIMKDGWTDHRTGQKINFDPAKHSIETGINNPMQFNAPEYDESIESLQRIVAVAQGVDTESGDVLAKAIQDFIDEQNVNSSIFKEFHDVPGYSDDLIKVANSYNFKVGYLVSNLKHGYDLADSYRQIQKTNNRDLIEYTDKYLQGLKSKDKSVFRIARTIGFINALGFNPSSAVMNYFHMPLVAMPYLKSIGMSGVKFGEGFANSLKGLSFNKEQALYFDVNKLNISEKDKDLLRKYAVSPEFSLLYGLPEGTEGFKSAKVKGARKLQGVMNYAASFLKASEDHMRASSFLSLLNNLRSNPEQLTKLDKKFSQDPMYLAKKNKDGLSPEVMASFLSDRMMFVGGNINKAPWERGLLGMVTQFKHYPASVIQLYGDMFKNAKIDNQAKAGLAIALLGLIAASGYNGLPFGEDILSMISNALKAITGKNINIDAEIRRIADSVGGPTFAQMLSKGALDISGLSLGPRIGMGRMLPQSTKFKDLMGPAGGALVAPFDQLAMMRSGFDPLAAMIATGPVALKNVGTALYIYPKYGATTKTGTQILTPEEMTVFDSAVKILGFNPQKVAQKQAESSAIYEAISEEGDIKSQTHKALARLLVEKSKAKTAGDKADKQKEIDKIYNKARENGLQLNADSIKRYILQIQNPEAYRMKYMPKKKRQKVEEIKRLY